ncbi:MAG: hypothetical protein WC959_03995 [Kiritimatiellales bacterium]
MKKTITGIIAAVSLLASGLHAAVYIWNDAVDADWNNAANWEGNIIPAVNTDGAVYSSTNTIRITAGTYMPAINVPAMASGMNVNLTTPLFIIDGGASLSMNSATAGLDVGAQNATAVTIGSGGSLTWSAGSVISLARNSGVQTYNINGTFTVTAPRFNLGYMAGYLIRMNLDGGTLMINASDIYATRTAFSTVQTELNEIILNNGSQVILNGTIRQIGENEGGYDQSLVFDILDTASRITFKLATSNSTRDFHNLQAVEDSLGKFFISSTLGNDALFVTDNGDGTVTVGAIPEPGSVTLFLVGSAVSLAARIRK